MAHLPCSEGWVSLPVVGSLLLCDAVLTSSLAPTSLTTSFWLCSFVNIRPAIRLDGLNSNAGGQSRGRGALQRVGVPC